MERNVIELQPFNETDAAQLISEIPDARFLLQWAGPNYSYPLDVKQLNETLLKAEGKKPSAQMFKAVHQETAETAGHIQLMDIDYESSAGVLGRVLIFRNYRGCGLGKAMVQDMIEIAFSRFSLSDITLNVFDFNIPAIEMYTRIGFSTFEFKENARQFKNEHWNIIRMKLNKIRWAGKKTVCVETASSGSDITVDV